LSEQCILSCSTPSQDGTLRSERTGKSRL
jgi:hypothetical protein